MKMNRLLTLLIAVIPVAGHAFDSGSTGADGALLVSADTELPLPPSGIFNFTTVNIAAGATLTFSRNAANTPVYILASGDVAIDGNINLNGKNSGDVGDADASDDGLAGKGGPGGFDGGHGGFTIISGTSNNFGATGFGPGGGEGNQVTFNLGFNLVGCGGIGGAFGTAGSRASHANCPAAQNLAYGSPVLLPLIGGSGGAGGTGSNSFGAGGAGGGGAILIAATGRVTINGSITANGGNTGLIQGAIGGGYGGGGSGGAIRVIATTIEGGGNITATGGAGRPASDNNRIHGGAGGVGRIRLEAENLLWTRPTTPSFSFAPPNPVFVTNLPKISIVSVSGIAAPSVPTGKNDVVLPQNTANPVEVIFSTSDIPATSIIRLTATPLNGPQVSADSTPIAADGSATASINLPNGPSVLIAKTTFTVTAALGKDFSRYAQGEQVEQVIVAMNGDGHSETTFVTVSGKQYTWPAGDSALN